MCLYLTSDNIIKVKNINENKIIKAVILGVQ